MTESLEEYVSRLLADAPPAEARLSAYRRGERHPRAKVTEADVREIRRRVSDGASPTDLAARFGVTPSAIHGITAGRTWRHVTDGPDAAAPGRDITETEQR